MTDLIVCLVVIVLMVLASAYIIHTKRTAKACGDGCAGCSMSGTCHATKTQKQLKKMAKKKKKAGLK